MHTGCVPMCTVGHLKPEDRMNRLYEIGAWFCQSAAVALLVCAMLVAPSNLLRAASRRRS